MEQQELGTGVNSMEEQVIDLQEMVHMLLKWWWLIAFLAIVIPVAAYFYTNFTYVPQYTAAATMVVNSKQLRVVGGQVVVSNDIWLSQKLVETYSLILKSDRVMELVAQDLGLNLPPSFISKAVSVAHEKDTEVLSVIVRNTDPELAAKICNSIMKVAPEAISSTVEVGSVNVVDYAKIPGYPEPPATTRNMLVGALLGLMLGVGFAFVFRYFDNTIKNDEDVKAKLGLILLGCIPYAGPKERKGQAVIIPSLSKQDKPYWAGLAFAEAYKGIRTNLLYTTLVNSSRKLLITSAMNGEGKSTTTINLAITLAQSGKSVLVIDCDLRKPSIHKLLSLQLEEGRGLASVLSGELEAKAGIVFMEGTGIYILPSGPIVPNPSELLGSENMAKLLALLEPDYDYILMDTPPACLVTDAVDLSKYADGVIFVVKQSFVKVDTIYLTLDYFNNVNARILGCVLNGIKYKEAGGRYKYQYHDRYLSHYYKEYDLNNNNN